MMFDATSGRTRKILRTIFYVLIIFGIVLLVMTVQKARNTQEIRGSEIPLSFEKSMTSFAGALVNIGTKGGRTITQISFDQGEVSEPLPVDNLNIALVPHEMDISDGALLSSALTNGKRIFGYKYSSRNATAEIEAKARADNGEPLSYSELFPGQFFASDAERNTGTFIADFESQKNIAFLPLSSVTLARDARYVIVTADQGTTFKVRGLSSVCGNGILEAGEACDGSAASGCSATCRAGLGDLVIDDGDIGFTVTGPWARTTTQGGWNGDRFVVPALNSSICTFGANCVMQSNATASWTFTSLPAGTYEVYVKWRSPETLRPASQHRIIDGQSELASVAFPWANTEKDATGQWGKLGSYDITSGTLKVETSNNVGWFNSQYPAEIIADAVMIRRSVCGDGVPEGGEACDDGGVISGDGCSASCTVESGYSSCSGAPSICVPIVCGDGKIEGSEICDDGNPNAGDGCSHQCIIESGYRCLPDTSPSICKQIIPNTVTNLFNVGATLSSTTLENDIVFGSDGLPIITYYDAIQRQLRVLHCDNETCSAQNTTAFIDNGSQNLNGVGRSPSIAIGGDGLPVISYYNEDQQQVKVAHCAVADCSTGTVISVIANGTDFSLSVPKLLIRDNGLPLISYHKSEPSGFSLHLVYCGNPTCSSGNTESTLSGPRTYAIAIGNDGNPIIAYTTWVSDSNNTTLWLKHCADPSCTSGTTSTIATSSPSIRIQGPLVLDIGADGFPVIGYARYLLQSSGTYYDLVHCIDSGCIDPPETSLILNGKPYGATIFGASLAIGADGLPIVSFVTPSGSAPVFHCGTPACKVGSSLNFPITSAKMMNSLAIGPNGLPFITYMDKTTEKLTLMKCGDNECYVP